MSLISTIYTSDQTLHKHGISLLSQIIFWGLQCTSRCQFRKTEQLLEGRRPGISLTHQDPNTAISCSKMFNLLPFMNSNTTVFTEGFSMKLERFQFQHSCHMAYATLSRQFHQRYLKMFTFHDLGRIYFCRYMSKGKDRQIVKILVLP